MCSPVTLKLNNNFKNSIISNNLFCKNNFSSAILPKLKQDTFVRNTDISFGCQKIEQIPKQQIIDNLTKLKLDPKEVDPKIKLEIASAINKGDTEKAILLLDNLRAKIKGNIIIISGPSGVGKDTVINELLSKHPEINTIISHTTRAPRQKDNEKNGINYYFVTEKDFVELKDKGKMFQWAKIGNFYYGATRDELEKKQKGHDVCLNMYATDALKIKKEFGEKAVLVFLHTGEANEEANLAELTRRIITRNPMSNSELQDRLKKAKEQLAVSDHFDYIISNKKNSEKSATQAVAETANAISEKKNPAFELIDKIKEQLIKIKNQ
ncbi:MAG: hypothetical protein WC197_01150 [Candidatus Gastranaerophilaceae bacterium]|jgi:guanylate kinase